MAPTPVSAAVPLFEQHILKPDEEIVLKISQLSTNLLNILRKNVDLGAEEPAQLNGDTGKALTWRQFLEQTVQTTQGMRALGLLPGDAITIAARNMTYSFTTAIAAYLGGVLEHPMYPYLEAELVVEQICIVRPRIIFAETFALDRIRAAIKGMSPKPRVVVLDSEDIEPGMMTMEEFLRLGSTVDVDSFEETHVENPDEDNALIIFTTGSTGPPKPVVHSARSVQHFMLNVANFLDKSVLIGPFVSWITGQGTLLAAVIGRTTLVYSTELTLDKQEQFIRDYQIEAVVGSPFSVLQMALRGPLPKCLKRIIVGGSPMRASTENIIRNAMAEDASIQPVYGATESCLMVAVQYKRDKHNSNGRLLPGVELQVRDLRTSRPLGPNQRGEIFIRTRSMMNGYLNNLQKTREVLDEQRWFKIGDYGYYDEQGYVYILDRLKDIVFYKDHLILPSELTDKIRLHPDVHDAAVCGIPHPEDNQHPVAFVSLRPGRLLTEEELNEHIAKVCDDSCRLRGGVVFLERVPRTLSGKVASTTLLEKVDQMIQTSS